MVLVKETRKGLQPETDGAEKLTCGAGFIEILRTESSEQLEVDVVSATEYVPALEYTWKG